MACSCRAMPDSPAFRIAPPGFVTHPALQAVLAAVPDARIVGGAVRDTLAGRAVSDVDLATPQPPDVVAVALNAVGLRALPTGLAHGTITALSDGASYEITTLRRDHDTDGRHARVDWTTDWQEDAARRDFTFNALSMTPDGAVWDYFGGAADLATGTVRFVGEPAARIAEDYLRILRFFRFHARYGHGAPDPAALDAIRGGVPGLANLSAERVWSELRLILSTPAPTAAVALMDELGVLQALVPGASAAGLQRLPPDAPPDPLLRLEAMRPGAAALAEALRLSTHERAMLLALVGDAPTDAMDDAALRRMLAETPPLALLGRAWLAGGGPVVARLQATPVPVFPLEGRDVVARGLSPGPAVGEHLRAVRAWWLDGGCIAIRADCLAALAARLGG